MAFNQPESEREQPGDTGGRTTDFRSPALEIPYFQSLGLDFVLLRSAKDGEEVGPENLVEIQAGVVERGAVNSSFLNAGYAGRCLECSKCIDSFNPHYNHIGR